MDRLAGRENRGGIAMDEIGRIQCDFCEKNAMYKNCLFWPATQEESMSLRAYNCCHEHFEYFSDLQGATGDEELIET
jgi:hypothetical protein